MLTSLYLPPSTPDSVFDAICQIVTGVAINRETRDKADSLRRARVAARLPDRVKSCTPLRILIRKGFTNLSPTLPKGYQSVAEYLDFYIASFHPDVRSLDDFRRTGLGHFRATDYARNHDLNANNEAGATTEASQVWDIINIQRHGCTDERKIPDSLLRQVSGLCWR